MHSDNTHLARVLHDKLALFQLLCQPHTMAPVLRQEDLQRGGLERVEGLVGASRTTGAGAWVAVDEGQPVEAVLCAPDQQVAAIRLPHALGPENKAHNV